MLIALLLCSTLFLSYYNGANDNFKGVATLYGSGTLSYKSAITIATITTFAGSICALFISHGLIASFSGKGLVPHDIAGATDFLTAVGFGAGCTVLLATRLGFPISTTHSLVGGLVGAGFMSVGWDVNFTQLAGAFLIPLLVSPFIAFMLGATAYFIFNKVRKRTGITKESCVCIGEPKQFVPLRTLSNTDSSRVYSDLDTTDSAYPRVEVADVSDCVDIYTDKVWGVRIQKLLDSAHIMSAAAVSFARGLNDTPKIAGLLVAAQAVDIRLGMTVIAIGIAIGGLLNARRVAETMSNQIAEINHGQGFSANLVTSFLVIIASKYGVPVSTTHVSVGSIFGIGMISKKRNTKVIRNIILSWLITLPVAMIFSALVYYIVS
jgi:PiT family inorganic phosphate transporter